DRVVAWSWLKADRGLLEYDVHPEHAHLLDELLDESEARAAGAREDDDEARAVLARHGFTKPGPVTHSNHRELPDARGLPRSGTASATAPSSRRTSPSASRSTAMSGSRRA